MSDSEYAIHNFVLSLYDSFGVEPFDEGSTPEETVEMLLRSINTPRSNEAQTMTSNVYNVLKQMSPATHEFQTSFRDLKAKNPRELKKLTTFLALIAKDKKLKYQLGSHAKKLANSDGFILTPLNDIVQKVQRLSTFGSGDSSQNSDAENIFFKTVGPASQHIAAMRLRSSADRALRTNVSLNGQWQIDAKLLNHSIIEAEPKNRKITNFTTMDEIAQARIIIGEIMDLFQGIEPLNIKLERANEPNEKRLILNPTLSPNLRQSLNRILPIVLDYDTTRIFIKERRLYRHGLVSQSLVEAMSCVLTDFSILISQVEVEYRVNALSITEFWCHLEPLRKQLGFLARCADDIESNDLHGGAILNWLDAKVYEFNNQQKKSQNLALFLLRSAAKPYFAMLQQWLSLGKLDDPYEEFCIYRNEHGIGVSDKLVTRLRHQMVPSFLEPVKLKILKCGQFISTMISCGHQPNVSLSGKLHYSIGDRSYIEYVDNAYKESGFALLNLLKDQYRLFDRIRSLKHYFLLDRSDYITELIDTAGDDLVLSSLEIRLDRLQSLLEMAIRMSSLANDPFKDEIFVTVCTSSLSDYLHIVLSARDHVGSDQLLSDSAENLNSDLSGYEAFTIDFSVQWPLNMIFGEEIISKYQIIFRRLFACKSVEQNLCNNWTNNHRPNIKISALRRRLLWLIQNYLFYTSVEVIEPCWGIFENSLHNAQSVQDVTDAHKNFLDTIILRCMLDHSGLVDSFEGLLAICRKFSIDNKVNVETYEESLKQFILKLQDMVETTEGSNQTNYSEKLAQRLLDLISWDELVEF